MNKPEVQHVVPITRRKLAPPPQSIYNCAFTWKLNDKTKPSFSRNEVIHRMYTIEMWLDIDEFFLPRDEGRLQRCIEEVNEKRTEYLLWNR